MLFSMSLKTSLDSLKALHQASIANFKYALSPDMLQGTIHSTQLAATEPACVPLHESQNMHGLYQDTCILHSVRDKLQRKLHGRHV